MLLNKKYHLLVFILLITGIVEYGYSQCISVDIGNYQACIESVVLKKEPLKRMKAYEDGTLNALFYRYFSASDLNSYKSLFLTKDWFELSAEDFTAWRSFIQNADIHAEASFEIQSQGMKIGIIKYTYQMDDLIIYETFLAKKSGNTWRPSSPAEEETYQQLSNAVKFINTQHLHSSVNMIRSAPGARSATFQNGNILADQMMKERNSIQVYQPATFAERYNPEFRFKTKDKYNEDRQHDAAFIAFLAEQKLSSAHADIVMRLIYDQDYLRAASIADEFSAETYHYMPFVDKIREVYGRDRIKKWDPVNQKWD